MLTVLVGGFVLAYTRDSAMSAAVLAALGDAGESWPVVFLGGMICLTAFLLPVSRDRVVRVLLLGACGFAVVAMYVLFQAPDLALTQLFFEIISVLLFVLVLRLLPADAKPCGRPGLWRPVLAAAVGLTLGWLTLLAATANPATRLGETFVRATYKGPADLVTGEPGRGGGGWNIVNVILVDFRGFDTLGEITVLGLGRPVRLVHARQEEGEGLSMENSRPVRHPVGQACQPAMVPAGHQRGGGPTRSPAPGVVPTRGPWPVPARNGGGPRVDAAASGGMAGWQACPTGRRALVGGEPAGQRPASTGGED